MTDPQLDYLRKSCTLHVGNYVSKRYDVAVCAAVDEIDRLRLALAERDRALEWVAGPGEVISTCGGKYAARLANDFTVFGTGPTPLAAIQAAMRAEQQSTTKGE